MKISFKTLFLLLCVLVLSACTNPLKKAETAKDGTPGLAQQEQVTYSCNDLKNDTLRANCKRQINSVILDAMNSEIINAFDAQRCVKLPQDMADICAQTIKDSGVQGPIADDQVQALRNAMDLTYKTTQAAEGEPMIEGEGYYDISKCAALTAPGLKEYCEKQLNAHIQQEKMFKIIEAGDATKCDELTDEQNKTTCKIELGVAVEEVAPINPEAPVTDTPPVTDVTTEIAPTTEAPAVEVPATDVPVSQ
jgi:hypothetical protein